MNDDHPTSPNGIPTPNHDFETKSFEPIRNIDATPLDAASTATAPRLESGLSNGNGITNGENGRSDSEAETVVLGGQQEGTTKKLIKHEDASDVEGNPVATPTRLKDRKISLVGVGQNGIRKPSLKRKRIVQESATHEPPEAGNSSNLSSTFTSPEPQPRSEDSNGFGLDHAPLVEEGRKKKGRLRKRKLEGGDKDTARQRRGKSDPSPGLPNGQERRGKRRVEEYDASSTRSESPQTHQHPRPHSTQPSNIHRPHSTQPSSVHSGVKRRKAPPSLSIENRRKASEDIHLESDDSATAQTRPHLQKSASVDEHAMRTTSHKKILDRSGRTPLARACANDNIEQLALELKERPYHLDEPDHAQNTPLQIAALGGFTNIVRFLLDEGCIVNSKNVDSDTPLIDAVENGHLEVVEQLLKAGADPRLRNGKGFEPLDLVNSDNDEDGAIRKALLTAKEKDPQRRPSEDHAVGNRDNDGTSVSASVGSPTDSTQGRAAPGSEVPRSSQGGKASLSNEAARRKTARSQATRDELLWINPTPERLRKAASEGDMEAVGHILNSRPADTESMLIAARGGHDEVLQLLIALGRNPEVDPDPLHSPEYRAGHNTPMLAAIGGGNVKVIELLLKQSGFDPTRRMYRGHTYFELAKQRQSSSWQQEYDLLKEAYDNYNAEACRKSAHGSPRKIRTKRFDTSSSPRAQPHNEHPSDGLKRQASHKSFSQKQVRSDDERKDATAVASDREAGTLAPPKSKVKGVRSASDVGSTGTSKLEASLKPRRRLVSRNEISDQDTRRRPSLAAEKSPSSSGDKPRREGSNSSMAAARDRRDSHQSSSPVKNEGSKKRLRTSISPHSSISEPGNPHNIMKKKKRRVDSQGNAIEHEQGEPLPNGPAVIPNMISSPEPILSPVNPPGTAPVAFMGGNSSSSPKVKSPDDSKANMKSPLSSVDRTTQQDTPGRASQSPKQSEHETRNLALAPGISPKGDKHETHEAWLGADLDQDSATYDHETLNKEAQGKKNEHERQENLAREHQVQAAKEREAEAARQQQEIQAREQEEARFKAQHEAEIDRQLQKERDEEEAREAKKRYEELQARRAEQERQQREKEERRQAELEYREQMRRIRLQEEKEQQRRDALPNGLRRAAELSPEDARKPEWINKWLPLYTVETVDLDPGCLREDANERWVANVQVAPILAITDLELSQCASLVSPISGEKAI